MFTEDRTAFFNDFGEEAILTVGGVPTTVTILYQFETEIFEGSLEGVLDDGPSITGQSSDFASAIRGDRLVVRGINYTLKEDPRDDFTGFFTASLQEA